MTKENYCTSQFIRYVHKLLDGNVLDMLNEYPNAINVTSMHVMHVHTYKLYTLVHEFSILNFNEPHLPYKRTHHFTVIDYYLANRHNQLYSKHSFLSFLFPSIYSTFRYLRQFSLEIQTHASTYEGFLK